MAEYFEALTDEGEIQINDQYANYTLAFIKKLGDLTYWGYDYSRHIYLLGKEYNDYLCYLHNPYSTLYDCSIGTKQLQNGQSKIYSDDEWYEYKNGFYKNSYFSVNQYTISVNVSDKSIADNFYVVGFSAGNKTPLQDGEAGLECRNANGEIVFSSKDVPLVITDFGLYQHSNSSYPLRDDSWSPLNLTKKYTNRIGFCMPMMGRGGASDGKSSSMHEQYFRLSSNQIQIYSGGYTASNKTKYYEKNGINAVNDGFTFFNYITMYTVVNLEYILKSNGISKL